MSGLFDSLDQRRAIIDRRDLAARLDAIAAESSDSGTRRRAMVALLRAALDAGRAEIVRWPAAARMIDRVQWDEAEPVAVAAQRLARLDRTAPAGLRPAIVGY